jgi:8-oxo-dGTP diphosphatase
VDFTDYDTRLAAYAVIVDERQRVLLALWNEGDLPQWTLPGGGVELHETPEQGAVREVLEETGYDVELGRVLGVDSHVIPAGQRNHGRGRPMRSLRVVYDARIVAGGLTHEQDGTTDEARWIPLDEVAGLHRVPLVDTALAFWERASRP